MGLDEGNFARLRFGVFESGTQYRHLRGRRGCCQPVGSSRVRDSASPDRRVHSLTTCVGIFTPTQEERGNALAAYISRGSLGKGTRPTIGSEHLPILKNLDDARRSDVVYSCDESRIALPPGYGLQRDVDRRER